jgi:hypothetical protein
MKGLSVSAFPVIILAVLAIPVLMQLTGCKKETTTIKLPGLTELYPLKVGKTFIYRLDSTRISPFGTDLVKISYQAKDSIESRFTDVSGRTSYRIFRYLRDTSGLQPWIYTATYVAVFDTTHTEFVDNNLRYINLVQPVTDGTTWYGNVYINTMPPSPLYFMDQWLYQYQNSARPYTVIKGTFPDTYTVLQQDQTNPPGPFDPSGYKERIYSVEVYARGTGLIYKNFLHWTWQPTPIPQYQDDSYGITLNLIDTTN